MQPATPQPPGGPLPSVGLPPTEPGALRPLGPDLRWALGFVRPYAGPLLLVAGLSLLGTGAALALPYLSKVLVDGGLLAGDFRTVLVVVIAFVALTALTFGLNVWSGLTYTRASADILFDMRLDLYRHLQRLSPRFYAATPLGEIVSRINNDMGEIQRVTAEAALAWVGNLLFLIGTVAILVWLDARLFLVSLVALPPSLWALIRYRRKLEEQVAHMRQRSADIGTFLIETLQGMRLVVRSNAEARERARFRTKNDSFIEALMAMRWYGYLAGGLPALLLSVGTGVVFLYGGARVIGGVITLGTFVAFMAYQMRLLAPVQALMGLYANLVTARVSLGRVREVLEAPVDVTDAPDADPLDPVRGRLEFRSVRVATGRGVPALEDVELTVSPGETLAIVGHSGSGKSTVADLLVRLLDPDRGRVLLDGRDLRTIRLADLRANVALVEQDPFIFHASVAENIAYSRPDASREEVEGAGRAAGLHAWVTSLPNGYDTVVGERGRALSAGERQRLAMARALLADAPVLILDEATGSLDPTSEAKVVDGYEHVTRGRTTILVTHRLSMAGRADRVVVLDGGRVVADGPVTELRRRPGPFTDLFRIEVEA